MVYFVASQPFTKFVNNFIEFANEAFIFGCSILVLTISNPNNSTEENLSIGWALIYAVSLNVMGNFVVVGYMTSGDLF